METQKMRAKRSTALEPLVFLLVLAGFMALFASQMGVVNMLSTIMQTAYRLLLDTVFYITAVAVMAGALAGLLQEFGVIAMVDKLLTPLMKPLFGLPGAASIGGITTYLSDNPAILTLANDKAYRCYFKKYQLPALTNFGTGFGMGAIITTFIIGLSAVTGQNYVPAALIGNLGAIIGSIVSTRIMLLFTKKVYGTQAECDAQEGHQPLQQGYRTVREGGLGNRFLGALLDGGAAGVKMGVDIVPGVLIICTFVMMLTGSPSADGSFTGAAYEGIGLLAKMGEALQFILKPLFGLSSAEGIAVPITALGSSGASLSIITRLLSAGLANQHDVAVFTAMCMCWSGYLSTHVAMMNSLGASHLTGKAILSHTIGGIAAGIASHWLYLLLALIF